MLRLHLQHIDELSTKIDALNQAIGRQITPLDQCAAIDRLSDIPGVDLRIAQGIVAELGLDMRRFPSAAHAASWARWAPAKNESAGRKRSSKTVKGNKYLKSALVQAAHAAARSKDNYLSAQYRRPATRRGKKRAAVAVARSILGIAFICSVMDRPMLTWVRVILTSVIKFNCNGGLSNGLNTWVSLSHSNPCLSASPYFRASFE